MNTNLNIIRKYNSITNTAVFSFEFYPSFTSTNHFALYKPIAVNITQICL